MNASRPNLSLLRLSLMLASGLCAAIETQGQSVWTDTTLDNKISTTANWSVAPITGSDVEFDGAGNQNIIYDLPSFTLNSVTFQGESNYVLGPSSLTNVLSISEAISNSVTNLSGVNVTVNIALLNNISVSNNNSTLKMGGIISGGYGFTLSGENTVVLTGANVYTGTTYVNSGSSLQIGDGVTPGATLTSDISDNGYVSFRPASSDIYHYNNSLSGEGNVQIYGAGKVIFGGSNTYSGTTYVDNGILADGAAYAFSPNSEILVNSAGGSLQVNYNEQISDLQNGGSGGPVSLASGATLTSYGNNYYGDFMGTISGLGSIVIDGGVQGFAGNNTFSGGIHVINDGEIFIGSNTALGTGTLTLEAGTEFSPTVNNLTLANPITLNGYGYIENEDGGSYNMTLNGQISGTGTLEWCTSGVLTLGNSSNNFTGGVDIRKGTVNLISTGAAGTGTIYIDSGSSLLISAGVTVANPITASGSAGSILGNGTISSAFTADGGIVLNPSASNGNGMGILTFSGGLTINPGAAIHFNLYDANGAAGTGYSSIATNTLSFSANANTITFNLVSVDASGNAAPAINFNSGNAYSWTVFSAASPITGFNSNLFNLDTSGFENSLGTGLFTFDKVGNNIVLDFSPVPEPSTWALMGLGLVALVPVGLRLRRRARA